MFPMHVESVEDLAAGRRIVQRGDSLFQAGDLFKSLYTIYGGFLKSTVASVVGRRQITGFYMVGDLLGWDGINSGRHVFDVSALEDTEVRVFPFEGLEDAASAMPILWTHLYKSMSREIVRDHEVMLLLGSMRAEERLAAFLLNLSQRFKACGYPHSAFVLRMTRAEIGSFLGLKLETVSRAFSLFVRDGLIEVDNRRVKIISAVGLRQVATGARP